MKPHELQAAIWVAMLKKSKGANYATDFSTAIEKNLKKMKIAKQDIKNMIYDGRI